MKTVIEMAREAGWKDLRDYDSEMHNDIFMGNTDSLKAFAELVRADERNSWPAEMEAMERQVNILTDELAEEREKWMERTAILIRGEREACAKLCDVMEEKAEGTECCKWPTPIDCAAAIRARGNT